MTHIIGKVYDMTQENFKKLIDDLEDAQAKIKELQFELDNKMKSNYYEV